ncbi:MAG: DUF3301 domain-containing protein [Luteimonas sp.]
MPTPLLLLIAAGIVLALWSAARGAAERAEAVGRSACELAGVQLLDQTVHASGLRLRRNDDGRLGVERSFRFEYSDDGVQRHLGRLVLRGDVLVSFSGPTQAASVLPLH